MYSALLSTIVKSMMHVHRKVMICGDSSEGFRTQINSEGDEC